MTILQQPSTVQQLDGDWVETLLAAVQAHFEAVSREVMNGREPRAIVMSLPGNEACEYLWLRRVALRISALRLTIARRSYAPGGAEENVIRSLNDIIAQVDADARVILECCTAGMSCDPSTMDSGDRKDYERLMTLAKRARCAMTILGLA